MTDQNTFTEVLREVGEIIRTSGESLSEEQIMEYFADMELSDGQKKLIIDYLNNLPGDEANEMEAGNGQSGINEGSEDSKILQAYMEDLSLLKTYSDEEKIKLYERLLSGESETIEILSAVWLAGVVEIAKKYMDLHSKPEDLIQEGNMALLLKLNELCGAGDFDDFARLEMLISDSIERGIMEYISEWNGAKEQENAMVGKLSLIHEASRYLEAENGMSPTINELAEYTNMSIEELSGYTEYLKGMKNK